MNCPSRNDEPPQHEGWNQNPSALAADLTTREDLNGTVNRRTNQDFSQQARDTRTDMDPKGSQDDIPKPEPNDPSSMDCGTSNKLIEDRRPRAKFRNAWPSPNRSKHRSLASFFEPFPKPRFSMMSDSSSSAPEDSPERHRRPRRRSTHDAIEEAPNETATDAASQTRIDSSVSSVPSATRSRTTKSLRNCWAIIAKFLGFVGPGFMVAVAYIDPGNYSTDVAAGVATQFKLLFVVLMSNIFAIVLQSLAIRLGTVTGLNLAEHCRAHLHPWLNIALYVLGEAAIISTDIAEVRSYDPYNRDPLADCILGHWICYSTQSLGESASGIWLSHYYG